MELTEQNAKRAANMVWTAAGDYEIKPLYLFYQDSGEPDLYRNTLEGLGYTCLAERAVEPFLRGVGCGRDPETYLPVSLLLWEQVIYDRCAAERPSLEFLRKEYAKERLRELSSPRRYRALSKERQIILRCRFILGQTDRAGEDREQELSSAGEDREQEPSSVGQWEAFVRQLPEGGCFAEKEIRLSWELLLLAKSTADDARLVSGMKELLWRYYMYRFLPARQEEKAHFLGAGLLMMLAGTSLSDEIGGAESGPGGAGQGQKLKTFLTHLKSETTPAEDRAFVEHTFGASILPPAVVRRMSESLCTGIHRDCSLWYAGAAASKNEYTGEMERQERKNRDFYEKNRQFFDRSIDRMADRLKHAIEAQLEPDVVCSHAGTLDPGRVYRVRALHDMSVFHREISHPTPDFTVDLLLDASSSRLEEQESIAAQAYMIAMTLMKLDIPVQVSCFRSMRRYTILQRLKEYGEDQSADGIFHFYAAGSNRDGLALPAMAPLMEQGGGRLGQQVRRRILLILTDAIPADTTKAFVEGRIPRRQDYMDELAVEDTRSAIRKLWKNGTYVYAIFWGLKSSVPDLKRMYGDSFIRIHEIGELPEAVIGLLLRAIASLRDNG